MKIKMMIIMVLILVAVGAYMYVQDDMGQVPEEVTVTESTDAVSRTVEEESLESRDEEEDVSVDSVSSATAEETGDVDEMPAVRRYFDSVARQDMEAFLSSFSDDALLTVVSRQMDTQEKLAGFAENEVFGGVYEIYRAEETESGIRILLQFTPQGWSSPEPMAVYDFTLVDDQISVADLQYASDEDLEYFRDKTLEKTSLMPRGYAAYLEGVEVDDMDLFLSGFTKDGQVLDVSRLIDGVEAIESWADREVLFLLYKVGRITYTEKGAQVINHIRLNTSSGGFYGSYDMTLEDGLISYADLQYSSLEEYDY